MKDLPVPEVEFPDGLCQFVGTPIGNLADITLRALAVLEAADVVFAEDTRHTGRLLARYGISARLVSYHDHNKERRVPQILERLRSGEKVAVVSDAGMPAINDPGFTLIRALAAADLPWSVVPGPSSVLAGLLLSGFATDRFTYRGYLPRKKGQRRTVLAEVLAEPATAVILESVHRIRSTLEIIAEEAPGRLLAVAREITKLHEETLRGTAAEVLPQLTGKRLKGELVLVLQGTSGSRPRAGVGGAD